MASLETARARGGRGTGTWDDGGDERSPGARRRPDRARHHRGLPRRDRDRAPAPSLAVRPDAPPAAGARPARAPLHRPRADGARGRARAARRGESGGGGGGSPGGQAGSDRGLFAPRLRPSEARTACGRRRAGGAPGRTRLRVERGAAGVSGVRALRDDDRGRLSRRRAWPGIWNASPGGSRRRGLPAPLVMRSSGGVAELSDATRSAAAFLLSGPAGGVVGAAYVARLSGHEDVLTFDMGGTSTDVAPVVGGRGRDHDRVSGRAACRSGSRWSTSTR